MHIYIVGFTERALALANRLAGELARKGNKVDLWAPARLASQVDARAYESLAVWAKGAFAEAEALIFVSACGIAVRTIAPYVRDKFCDPAVVCVDEAGRYAVPLLSGHVGGANKLARCVAALCGGQVAISTATDVQGVFAVDEWAAQQGLAILDRAAAKEVSAALLAGEHVGWISDLPVSGELPKGLVTGAEAAACRVGISLSLNPDIQPFEITLRLVPRVLSVGIGCKRGTPAQRIAELVERCLREVNVAPQAVAICASIDRKADEEGLRACAEQQGWDLRFHSAQELAAVRGNFVSSEFVRQTVGVDNVCERAACAEGETLLLGRRSAGGVTAALGYREPRLSFAVPEAASDFFIDGATGADGLPSSTSETAPDLVTDGAAGAFGLPSPVSLVAPDFVTNGAMGTNELPTSASETASGLVADGAMGADGLPSPAFPAASDLPKRAANKLVCVGLGPGAGLDLTQRACRALEDAELIVGYTTYIDLIRESYAHKELLATPMRAEVTRCQMALEQAAQGRRVAMVCSGDPGIYGMAGLLFELQRDYPGVQIEVIPGVSAANGGAAVLGAPLMHDWCSISLSDLMTPWETIEQRLAAAAQADFCIALYNPASRGRRDYLRRACDVLLRWRGEDTACGYVRNIGREGQEYHVLTLGELREAHLDMLTCVYVGNAQTQIIEGRLVTPRGYLQRNAGTDAPDVVATDMTASPRPEEVRGVQDSCSDVAELRQQRVASADVAASPRPEEVLGVQDGCGDVVELRQQRNS